MCYSQPQRRLPIALALIALGFSIGLGEDTCAQTTSSATSTAAAQQRPWLERKLTVNDRVSQLIHEMTLEEKIGQMAQANSAGGEITGTDESGPIGDFLSARVRR